MMFSSYTYTHFSPSVPSQTNALIHFQNMELKLIQVAQNVQEKVSKKLKVEDDGKKMKKLSLESVNEVEELSTAPQIKKIKKRKALANLRERVVLYDLDIGAEVEIRTPSYWGKKNDRKEVFDEFGNIIIRERKTYTKRKMKEPKLPKPRKAKPHDFIRASSV